MKSRRADVGAVLGALVLQILLLQLPGMLAPVALVVLLILLRVFRITTLRVFFRTVRGLLIMLGAVLFSRLIVDFSNATVIGWVEYASRLLAAIVIAVTLLKLRGPTGIQRGLTGLLRPLPSRFCDPILDITDSALYMIPAIKRHFKNARDAARIRFSARPRSSVQRMSDITRSALVAMGSLPRQRAEAMVVRGIIKNREGNQ